MGEAEWLRSLMGEVAGRQVVGWKIGGSYHAMRQPPAQPSPAAPASKGHHSFPHPRLHPHPPILCTPSAPTPTPTHCTSNRALDDWTDWIFWHLTPAKAKPNNQVCRESLSGYKYAPTASVCQQVPASDSNTMPLLTKGVMGEAASHTSFH